MTRTYSGLFGAPGKSEYTNMWFHARVSIGQSVSARFIDEAVVAESVKSPQLPLAISTARDRMSGPLHLVIIPLKHFLKLSNKKP